MESDSSGGQYTTRGVTGCVTLAILAKRAESSCGCSSQCGLFVAEGFDGIEPGGFPGGEETKGSSIKGF